MLYSLFSKIWKEAVLAQWKEGIIMKLPKKETLGTAATIEGSCSCQCQARFSTGFYWRGWRKLSTPGSDTSRQASGRTDLMLTRSPESASSWNSHWSGTPPPPPPSLNINFTDYEKAFDSVDGETMWKVLRDYGVPEKIVSLIWYTFQDMSYRTAHTDQLSESFEVKTGVQQGCLLSPFLFLLVINWIMKTTTTGRNNGIQWTLWMQLDDLNFADDLALLSHNHSQMQGKTSLLETTSAGTGLKINRKKT